VQLPENGNQVESMGPSFNDTAAVDARKRREFTRLCWLHRTKNQVFCTTIFGNLLLISLARSAILTRDATGDGAVDVRGAGIRRADDGRLAAIGQSRG
jgi:hypothetical protein